MPKNKNTYHTTGGAGYLPSFNLEAVAQDLRNQAYRKVRPTGYTYSNAKSFFGKKKGRVFGDPNTEGLWGMYTGQDSIIADRTQAPEGLPAGRPLTVKEAVSYGYSPKDDNTINSLSKYAVKDIVIPSRSKQGAYELAYPNQAGNIPHLPYNSNDVPEDSWPHSHQLGTFHQMKGTDEKGTYVIYKDLWDINPFRGQSSKDDSSWGWFIEAGKKIGLDKIGDIVPFGKPFEVYGKQYYDKSGKPIKEKAEGGFLQPKDAWDSLSLPEQAAMMKVAVKNGIYDLPTIRQKYNEFAEGGSKEEEEEVNTIVPFTQRTEVIVTPDTDYNQYLNTLPDNQRFTPNDRYDSYLYWKLNGRPRNFEEAYNRDMFHYDHSDNAYHANSIAFGPDGIGYFMKPKDHDTVGYELDWFNKGLVTEEGGYQRPETPEEKAESDIFRRDYRLMTDPNRPNYYMYKPKNEIYGNTFDDGGLFGNETVDAVASFLPILGTAEDAYTFYKDPSLANAGWLALSLGSDIFTGGMAAKAIKAMRLANKASDAAKATNKAAKATWEAGKKSRATGQLSGADNLRNIRSLQAAGATRQAAIQRANDALFGAGVATGVDQGTNLFFNASQMDLLPTFGMENQEAAGGKIHIKPSHRGRLTDLKKRTGKTEAELYNDGNPAHKKMVVFARNSRKWKHGEGGLLVDMAINSYAPGGDIVYGHPYYSYDENGQLVRDENRNPILNYNATLPEIVVTPSREPLGIDRLARGANTNSNPTVGIAARGAGEAALREKNRRTTEAVERFNSHNEMHSIFPVGEVSGETIYKGVTHPKVIGMSGADPIAETYVFGKAIEPLLGVADIIGEKTGRFISRGNYSTPTMELNSLRDINSLDETVPTLDILKYVGESLRDARNYKTSEGYRALAKRAGEESKAMGTGFFPAETFTDVDPVWPWINFSKKELGKSGSYNEETNTIELDLEQAAGLETPFHEGLHWQLVGEPSPNIGPKYAEYREALRQGLPKDVRAKLLAEHKKYPEEVQKVEYANNAMMYLRQKVDNVLVDNYPRDGYMRNPKELQANGTETGRALGIEPFTPYPGYEEAVKIIEPARKYNKNLEYVKADTPEEVENFWKIISGNYIPSVLGGSVIVNSLNNE